jgi:hypothetical protein
MVSISISISYGWLNIIIIPSIIKHMCVCPSILQMHHWTILGIVVLSSRDKQFTILSCKIDLTDPINEPRQCISLLVFDNPWCTTNCLLQQRDLDRVNTIHTASRTYVNVLSLCHLYPFTSYLKNTNENFQKIPFSCNSSHNFTPKKNELRYHCCLSQLYFIGHY